ncbi:MAG: hypothetical protein ABI857_08930 [Acidobacteriota bacterium]
MNRQVVLPLVFFLAAFACRTGNSQPSNLAQPVHQSSGYVWTQLTEHAEFPTGYNFPVFVAKGKMWAFHAESIWSSTNGIRWTRSPLPSLRKNVYQSDYVLFDDTVYALGDNTANYENIAFKPRVRRTINFQRWQIVSERSNLPGRIFRGVVVFDGKMWALGGYDGKNYFNDVWNSTDGVRWSLVTEHAGWSQRTVGTTFVFKGRLYLIGGGVIDGQTSENPHSTREIWSSTDGKTWTMARTETPAMNGGTPVVYEERFWLVGANRDGAFGRSSLVSEDVENWIEHQAPWTPRGGAAAWVYNNKLYMTGGKYSVTENGQIRFIYSNDVWVMTKK